MNAHPILAREGWWHCLIAVSAALAGTFFLGWWAMPLWLLCLFVIQFFRDPARNSPTEPGLIVAPADGQVIFLGEAQDPFLHRPAKRISVFMNVFSVHSNRAPEAGEIVNRWYHEGRFFNAALDKASEKNERCALHLRTDSGQDIVFVQIAGLIARRILCYVDQGQTVVRGQRYGFIRFGSRVDVYLPVDATWEVALHQKVVAGENVIARLK